MPIPAYSSNSQTIRIPLELSATHGLLPRHLPTAATAAPAEDLLPPAAMDTEAPFEALPAAAMDTEAGDRSAGRPRLERRGSVP